VATGRNIFSAKRVLPDNLPIDFLIFSSGVGIIDWKTKNIINENHLIKEEVDKTLKIFLKYKVDFMVHEPVPEKPIDSNIKE